MDHMLTLDKPWYTSWTVRGIILFGLASTIADAVCGLGIVTTDNCEKVYKFLEFIGGSTTVLGLRRNQVRSAEVAAVAAATGSVPVEVQQ
jgi:hypothetical protein